MKKLLSFVTLIGVIAFSSCEYDDGKIWDSVHGLEDRVAKLEELCKQMNTNISSLQTIVTALQSNDYVTGVTSVMQGGKEVGYTITFSKSNPITIYHGKDGQDGEDGTNGKDGVTPAIGVKQDTDGIYYWTLDGDWLTDEHGGKIKAEGKDGQDGSDGEDGTDGTNGNDGITPQFKIENDYWFISYDNGTNWTQLGKATGEDGKDGEDGIGGDSMFSGVDYKTSTDYVIFTLADGTQIKLPTWSAFEALQRFCNETNTNLSALQTIVTALQNNDYITSVDPLTENGKVVGYTIKFVKSNPIVIYNGKDGTDGVDGNTPVIGVKKDGDGIYYWTLDGEFIVVDGQKIKAQGTDGNDGTDGTNGRDGITPKLEIREGYWWISYDNGKSWTQLGKATGEDGKDGESIKITQDENNVYFELVDGTVITISKSGEVIDPNIIQFEDENVKKLCIAVWDTDGDHELSYDEAAIVTTLGTTFKGNTEIQFFNELKHFTSLTTLDTNSFYGCSSLLCVTIPINITVLNSSPFSGCSQLKRVIFDKGSKLKEVTQATFPRSIAELEIPASVEFIGDNAFKDCQSLSIITFEKDSNLKSIGKSAFDACILLTTIEIPSNVETIGEEAFRRCIRLENITFEKGSRLTSITGDCVNESGGHVTPHGTFLECTSLTRIEIPASVTTIGSGAFHGCSSLEQVSFEKGSQLITIKDGRKDGSSAAYGTFTNCDNLTLFDASNCTQIRAIGNYAFNYSCRWQSEISFTIKLGTEIPPTLTYNKDEYWNSTFDFSSGNSEYLNLIVPAGCADAYKNAETWKEFRSISELDE